MTIQNIPHPSIATVHVTKNSVTLNRRAIALLRPYREVNRLLILSDERTGRMYIAATDCDAYPRLRFTEGRRSACVNSRALSGMIADSMQGYGSYHISETQCSLPGISASCYVIEPKAF